MPIELRAWQSLTRADFALHLFSGGHFYLNEQMQPLLITIVWDPKAQSGPCGKGDGEAAFRSRNADQKARA